MWVSGDRRPRLQHTLAAIFSIAGGIAALALIPFHSNQVVFSLPLGPYFGSLSFIPDGLGILLASIASVIGSLAVIFSIDYMHGEPQLGRYYALVLVFIGAMSGLVLTNSFMFLFIFWEITALCSYALISFYNDDPKAVKGGIKALIITQIGGIGLLAGALISYSYFGSFEISNFMAKAHTLPATVLSIIAFGFIIAAAAKSAQIPFHTWLPDAMEAPTPVSALIHAATMVNAGVYLLARFYPSFSSVPGWKTTVIIVGALSALLAALMALVANDLKRVLAYSTVSQLGYMVYAVGVGGFFASQYHLLSHAVFKALLFLGAGAVIHAVGTRDMRQMGGLGKQMPLIRNTFIIGSLALIGIPILNGFWSKELVLEAGLTEGPQWAYLIMLVGVGLTAFYTFRMVWMVFYGTPDPKLHFHDAPAAMRVALITLAIGSLTTWLLAGPLSQLLQTTLPYHNLQVVTTLQVVEEVITTPATYLALVIIAAGLACWWWRSRLASFGRVFSGVSQAAEHSFGFEWINTRIVRMTETAAESLRQLQTGQLSWNAVGIVVGLIIILAVLALWRA